MSRPVDAIRVNPRLLLSAVLAVLATQNLLVWRYLGFTSSLPYVAAVALVGGLIVTIARLKGATEWKGPTLQTLCLLGIVSVILFLLGGEGRVFYANVDWQIRDAVVHDLTVNNWPFVYRQNGTLELLRAPIGMFLIPALVGKATGPLGADVALLAQNSLLLTLLLGLGATLFSGARESVRALIIVIVFSGMDLVGQLLRSAATGEAIPDHIEAWAGSQFSSHLTQIFWVPQHGMSGWIGALLFLLWRERRISLGQFYAPLPMLMLLSPLGVMGTIPFAAYAGIVTLLRRELRVSDFALSVSASLLCLPGILYLGAAGGNVGIHLLRLGPVQYVLFEILEAFTFVLGVALIDRGRGREKATLMLVAFCLLVAPFVQLGEGMDFTMRVSITSLAILSVQVAWALSQATSIDSAQRPATRLLVVALAIGSATGIFEVARAVAFEASPRVQCSVTSAGEHVVGLPHGSSNATYFAPLDALPALLRHDDASIVDPQTDGRCWDRAWKVPRFG